MPREPLSFRLIPLGSADPPEYPINNIHAPIVTHSNILFDLLGNGMKVQKVES